MLLVITRKIQIESAQVVHEIQCSQDSTSMAHYELDLDL